jgi:thiamine-monophosphate kinase
VRLKDAGEIKLIEGFASRMRLDSSVIKGPGDDAAVIRWTRDKYLLLTCDMVVGGVHFRMKDATPFEIGWKAMARNISDIAAMGGVGRYALASVAIDRNLPVSFANDLVKGMRAVADKFGVSIVGGDMSDSKKLVIDISLAGEVEKKNVVYRSGAKVGDVILVTGSIGGSGKRKHLTFTPRVEEGRYLVKNFRVNSMIDVSDGLAIDLWRILKASSVGATLYANMIPLSRGAHGLNKAISEGEDFELLFTMSAGEAMRLCRAYPARMRTPVTIIGEVTKRSAGYRIVSKDGASRRLGPEGYEHF